MHDPDPDFYDRCIRKMIIGGLTGIAIGVIICTFILIPLLSLLH